MDELVEDELIEEELVEEELVEEELVEEELVEEELVEEELVDIVGLLARTHGGTGALIVKVCLVAPVALVSSNRSRRNLSPFSPSI